MIDDGNGKYNLLLLCWGQQQASPIHDHAGAHCILKVMDGQLTETRYDWPEQNGSCMEVKSVGTMGVNDTDYMHGMSLILSYFAS